MSTDYCLIKWDIMNSGRKKDSILNMNNKQPLISFDPKLQLPILCLQNGLTVSQYV